MGNASASPACCSHRLFEPRRVFSRITRDSTLCGMLSGVDRDDQIDRSCTRFLLITYSRLRNTTSFGIHLEFTHG